MARIMGMMREKYELYLKVQSRPSGAHRLSGKRRETRPQLKNWAKTWDQLASRFPEWELVGILRVRKKLISIFEIVKCCVKSNIEVGNNFPGTTATSTCYGISGFETPTRCCVCSLFTCAVCWVGGRGGGFGV